MSARQQRARSRPHSAHAQEAKEADGFPVQGADGAEAKFPSSAMRAPEKRPCTLSAALSLATGAVFELAATFSNCQAEGSLIIKLFSLLPR
jgi:hypothetical protein